MSEQARRSAAQRYAKAVDDLRRAREQFADACVPMDPVRRQTQDRRSYVEPPEWTDAQRRAVLTYANAWRWLQLATDEWQSLHRDADAPPS